MDKIFTNLHNTLIAGLVLVVVAVIILHVGQIGDHAFWAFIFRLVHVFFGVLWIGLLYYFNFVQTPSMPKIPDEQKPAISKVIAPAALFYFRWAAAMTVLFGIITILMNGYFMEVITFQMRTLSIGVLLALIMAFNVWFIIWPNQKKVLGIVEADADSKKKAGRAALLASRTNVMLSLPMLYCMVAVQNVG